MEVLQSYITDNQYAKYAVAGVAVTVASVFVVRTTNRVLSGMFKRTPRVECPPGSVLLVQVPRGPYAPSLSPFPIKLETYLKINNIPYVTDVSGIMSDKGKTPWIIYEGEKVADSQFCIEFLNKKFNKDMNRHLSKEDRAVAESLRIMIDEHFYWCIFYLRWIGDPEQTLLKEAFKVIPLSGLFLRFYCGKMKKMAHAQGMGRHSLEEILHIFRSDLQVIADYLGNKDYLMGDTPCEVDCSAFGALAQCMWQDSYSKTKDTLKEEFPSLARYCERMKERFWPDWDDCITNGGTRQATK